MQPQYNDIFNNVFKAKTPVAVNMAEKTEARLKIIRQRFNLNNNSREENDQRRYIKDVMAKTLKENSDLEKATDKRKNLEI